MALGKAVADVARALGMVDESAIEPAAAASAESADALAQL
jgi:hypothetical protein